MRKKINWKGKKLGALALSAAMCLSVTAPALASSNTTKITGMYKEVPIAVTVPTTGTAIINPYGLPVKIESTDEDADDKKTLASISGQKITTMPMAIYSKTEVGLLVSATVTGEVKGNLKLSTAAIPENSTTNNALIFLETKSSNLTEEDLAVTADEETNTAASTTMFGPFEGWSPASGSEAAGPNTTVTNEVTQWGTTAYSDARNQILVGTTAKSKTGIGYLTKASESDGGTLELARGGAMWFRLAGDVVSAPKIAWTSKDGATVTVAFTFAPAESAGSPGTIANVTLASNSSTTAVPLKIDTSDATGKPFMTFGADATYQWEVEAPDGASVSLSDDGAAKEVTMTGYSVAGDYTIKLTVTENNVPYVATKTVTCTAPATP